MPQTLLTLIDILKNQGFSFLLMGSMLYYLNNQLTEQKRETKAQMDELKIEVKACNKTNQDLLLNQLNRNNQLLEQYEANHGDVIRKIRPQNHNLNTYSND